MDFVVYGCHALTQQVERIKDTILRLCPCFLTLS